jgi:ABC-type nickel/cobalt efflux system permease component RcnA
VRRDIEEQLRQERARRRAWSGALAIGLVLAVTGVGVLALAWAVEKIMGAGVLAGLLAFVGVAVAVGGVGLAAWALREMQRSQS